MEEYVTPYTFIQILFLYFPEYGAEPRWQKVGILTFLPTG